MQFRDLKTQYQVLKPEMDTAVTEVMASAAFINGPAVKELEQQLAEYVGVKHCITCANGTDGLSLAMMAWGIGPGDAVFVPDFTFFSSGEVASFAGATPVFVDVSEDTFNMDPKALEAAIAVIQETTDLVPKVAVAVDLFGLPADLKVIGAIAKKYGMYLLEDGAQGFGGAIDGKRACSFGDISTTSFFPAKPLGCYGDGGAVFTDNDEWADLIRSYCVHGKGTMKYDNVRVGLNSRLDTIQAAILQIKLKALEEYELADVNKAAEQYTARLKDAYKVPVIPDGFYSSWAQYTIQLPDGESRDALQAKLKEAGVPSMVYYPKPMHQQLAFANEENFGIACPVTERLCQTVLSLPMHPYLTGEDIETVTAELL